MPNTIGITGQRANASTCANAVAPASSLAARFPHQLALVLAAHGITQEFINHELAQMRDARFAKTANRSVVGVMNQFSYLAEVYRDYLETDGLVGLSLKLSETPCKTVMLRMASAMYVRRRSLRNLVPPCPCTQDNMVYHKAIFWKHLCSWK